MNISNLKSANLLKVIRLVESRDDLLEKLQKIETQIQDALFGESSAESKSSPRGKSGKATKAAGRSTSGVKTVRATTRRRKGRRGALKASILASLSAAGSHGVSAKELSSSLKVPNQNIHVWFSSTGKKIKEIGRNKDGRWFLKSPVS